jgi:riboflavin kinase/FMN adenylyltransferase
MKIITSWQDLKEVKENIVLNIGNFDGIHIGHQSLINKGLIIARENKEKLAVLTFNPHPQHFFKPNDFKRITTKAEMKTLLIDQGVDIWFDLPFNFKIAKLSPEDFLRNITQDLTITNIVVGFNFKFGYKASGDVDFLQSFLYERNIGLVIHEPVMRNGTKVSSTLIRKLIEDGKIEKANELMCRPYMLSGDVVHGMGRGTNLGFPTANLEIPDLKLLPKKGVYAGFTDNGYIAAINIGNKPTFLEDLQTVEVHLIDFPNRNLYGKNITVYLTNFLREEKKFDTVEMLKDQVKQDIVKIKVLNPVQLFTTNM